MMDPRPPWLIVGCGYTGTQLVHRLLASGLASEVTITRRDPDNARALGAGLGVEGVGVDLPDLGALKIAPGTIVVCLAPPGSDPAGEIDALVAAAHEAARIVYVSSTGVYGPGHGAWVDEAWPIAPITESGRARAAAEAALVRARVPWLVLRAAGIYGPGRGLVDRILARTYRVVGDGESHVGRIHVVDLVEAIVKAASSELTGAINAADSDPAPIGAVADEVARQLGLPPPPRVPVSSVPAEVAGMLTADRRIANQRLTGELGVVLRYPSWRTALDEEVRRRRST